MSLCGPSTAPQALSKHLQTDRTLQQERLRTGPSSSQSFRSTHTPSPQLDLEFEAFSGIPAGLHAAPPHIQQAPLHHAPAPIQHYPQQHRKIDAGWAADFQALSLHSTKSTSSLRQQASAPRTTAPGWGADFLSFAGIQNSNQTVQRGSYAPRQPYYTATATYGVRPAASMESMSVPAQTESASTAAAFDAAFEEVAMMDAASQQDALDALDLATEEAIPVEISSPTLIDQPQPASEQPLDKSQETDALARTAGELLDSVQSDQSDKFRESKFLALMRKLRDKEAKVEGDKLVENVVPAGSREEGKGKEPVREVPDWTSADVGMGAYV